MRVLFKTTVVALAVSLVGALENTQSPCTITGIAQAQEAVNYKPIPLALPLKAKVVLKNRSSMTGQVTTFDPKKQTIEVSVSNVSSLLQIPQIQQISFEPNGLFYNSDGQLVIRGTNEAQAQQRTWTGIPLNAFVLLDPKLGQASVDLAGVMDRKQLRQIRSVAVRSLYVANEIKFEPDGKMTLKVTPSDHPF